MGQTKAKAANDDPYAPGPGHRTPILQPKMLRESKGATTRIPARSGKPAMTALQTVVLQAVTEKRWFARAVFRLSSTCGIS